MPRRDTPPQDWREQIPEAQRRRLRLWFWSVAAVTFAVVVIGGITRLTHSGLSIVDWRPLMGVVPPLNETQWGEVFDRYRQFPEYQQLRRGMTLGEFKQIFFWEYLHRLGARAIGAVFLIPFVLFWRAGYLARPLAVRALALFALGALQGAVGWLMVKSGLVDRPSVSHYRLALHLTLAVTIVAASVWLARDLAIRSPRAAAPSRARRALGRGLSVVGALLAVQIVWGAFVAGMKAGLFFGTFPLIAGRLVPPGWLALDPAILNFVQNPGTVQWVHRVLGTVLLLAVVLFVLRAGRIAPDRPTYRLCVALLPLIASQYLLGVLTLVYHVPVLLAAAHQAMALVTVAVWVAAVHHVHNLAVVAVLANEGAGSHRRAVDLPSGRGERFEGLGVQQEESFLLGEDDALLAPAAHDADGGLDRRARQVGELLPREHHRDERAVLAGAAHLSGKLQEQAGETRLHAAAGELREAVGELDQPVRQAEQEPADEAGILLEQAEERGSLDRDAAGVLDRDRRGGEGPALVDRDGAERIADAEDLQNHVLAGGRRLEHLHPAAGDDVKTIRRAALGEDLLAASILLDPCERRQTGAVLGRDLPEDRRRLQQPFDAPVHRAILADRNVAAEVMMPAHDGGHRLDLD